MNPLSIRLLLPALVFSLITAASGQAAGVFNTPRFIQPGDAAIGVEPELVLTNGAGLGVNVRYQQGLTELNNATVILGTGGGPRRFRVGVNTTFDFFPDVEGQPGIGIAVQGLYYRLRSGGRFDLTGIPYIHKTFISSGNEVEPFFAIPIGIGFRSGTYETVSNAVVGAMFKNTEKVRYVMELGIELNHSESYISGGVIYYP